MLNVSLLGYKIKNLSVINNMNQSHKLEINPQVIFNMYYAKDNTIGKGVFDVKLTDSNGEFSIELEYEGYFGIAGYQEQNDKKKIHITAYDTLFSYVNQIIVQIGQNSGIMGLALKKDVITEDSISFKSQDEDEENEKMIQFPADTKD